MKIGEPKGISLELLTNLYSRYRTKVLVADKKSVEDPISYTTQYKCIVLAFRLANIITVIVTYVIRACGAQAAERHGVSYGDVSLLPPILAYLYIISVSIVLELGLSGNS